MTPDSALTPSRSIGQAAAPAWIRVLAASSEIEGGAGESFAPAWREICRAAGLAIEPALSEPKHEKDAVMADRRNQTPEVLLFLNGVSNPGFSHPSHPSVSHPASPWPDDVPPDSLILVNCLAVTPTRLGAALNAGPNVVGYSDIGLYTGGCVLEIAGGVNTPSEALAKARQFFESLGLRVVEVPESPALALGRILAMLVNEAAFALMEGVADAETIDTAMRLGVNYPLGPLAWGDAVGLDVIVAILNHLEAEFGEERYHPAPPLLRNLYAGRLGRKTGVGFHTYPTESIL